LSLVLDVGCGENKRGTVGVDIRRTGMVDVLCDAHHLPFVDGIFEGCYAYAILEHVENPVKVLKEISRVLMDSGWLEVLVPTDSRLRSDYIACILSFDLIRCYKVYYKAMKSGEHKWQYSEQGLKQLLRLIGFETLKVERPPLPIVWGRKGRILAKMGIVRHPHLIMRAVKMECLRLEH
jgi:SAM-dependent methyltransferase